MPNTKHSILIVDDDEDLLKYLTTLLSTKYTVHTAASGEAAMVAPEVDLALIDQHLPDTKGNRLARHFRDKNTPFAFISADTSDDARKKIRRSGALGKLTKPLDKPDEILTNVGQWTDRGKDINSQTRRIALEKENAIIKEACGILEAHKNLSPAQVEQAILNKAATSGEKPTAVATKIVADIYSINSL